MIADTLGQEVKESLSSPEGMGGKGTVVRIFGAENVLGKHGYP